MGLKIDDLRVNPTTEVHLTDADDNLLYAEHDDDGNGIPESAVVAVVYGPSTKQYRKANQLRNNFGMNQLKKSGKTELTAEQQQEQNVNFLTMVTREFRNLDKEDADGVALEGKDLVRAVYRDEALGFIMDKVGAEVGEWGNYSEGSGSS